MLLVPYRIICSSYDVIKMLSVPGPCTQTTYLFVDLLTKPHILQTIEMYISPHAQPKLWRIRENRIEWI
jgi:hypothetical protein